jgi:hypothetical protein
MKREIVHALKERERERERERKRARLKLETERWRTLKERKRDGALERESIAISQRPL